MKPINPEHYSTLFSVLPAAGPQSPGPTGGAPTAEVQPAGTGLRPGGHHRRPQGPAVPGGGAAGAEQPQDAARHLDGGAAGPGVLPGPRRHPSPARVLRPLQRQDHSAPPGRPEADQGLLGDAGGVELFIDLSKSSVMLL